MKKISDIIWLFPETKTVVACYGPSDAVKNRNKLIELSSGILKDTKTIILEDYLEGAMINPMEYEDEIQFRPLPQLIQSFKELENIYYINGNAKLKKCIEHIKRNNTGYDKFNYLTNLQFELLYRTQESFNINYLRERTLQPKYHMISLNGVAKYERSLILSRLITKDTYKKIQYSWMKRYDTERDYSHLQHTTKWFNPSKIRLLDANSDNIDQTQERVPIQYHQSLVDVFVESDPQDEIGLFITEKTWKPLMIGKVFLGLNSPGYYEYLENLGFKMYHNLFDYSFDKEINFEKRSDMYLEQLHKILNLPLEKLSETVRMCDTDIQYNKELARNFEGENYDCISDYKDAMKHLRGWR